MRDRDFFEGFAFLILAFCHMAFLFLVRGLKYIILGALLTLGVLWATGAIFQEDMPATKTQTFTPSPAVPTPTGDVPVAVCPDCYYREPTPEELEFAERVWQEWWGEMELQEFVDGAVLER